MSDSIRNIDSIGLQAGDLFNAAGFHTMNSLKKCVSEGGRTMSDITKALRVAAEATKNIAQFDNPDYRKRLVDRCVTIIYRARSAEAMDFAPAQYMCPLSLDWFYDPVITPSGYSYSRTWLVEHLKTSKTDPLSHDDISKATQMFIENHALRAAVEHNRIHMHRYHMDKIFS